MKYLLDILIDTQQVLKLHRCKYCVFTQATGLTLALGLLYRSEWAISNIMNINDHNKMF